MVREMKHTEIGDIPNNWVTMPLDDFCIIKDGTHGTYNRKKDGCLLLSAKNVFDNYLNVSKNESYISESDYFFITQNGFPQKGDILFSCVGSIGRCCIFDGLTRAAFQRSVAFIRTNDSVDNRYLMYAIQGSRCQSQIQQLVSASTQGGLYLGAIGQIVIAVPPIDEQKVIAQALTEIDNLILSEEKVIKKIKTMKSGCLSLMYPKHGNSVPEIRLSGFSDPWEQRKLGEICQVTMGQSPDGATYSDEPSDYILVQGNADLKDGWVFPRIWTTQKTKTAQAYDLIMSVRAPAGAIGKTAYDVVLGRGVAGIKGNEFIYQSLVKFDADGYWKKIAAGSTFESVNSDEVKNAIISIPQDIEEQEKIGEYFSNLDHFITLHQHKLEKYKAIKQGMMNELLTGKIRLV